MQIDWTFLSKQFPVAILAIAVIWLAFSEARKIVVGQRKDFKDSLEKQQTAFAKVIEGERKRLTEFWDERDIKLENIIAHQTKELKEIGRQNAKSNKILVYMSVNNPTLIRKSRSEKMNELLDILKEPDGI